ncbi:hypothetical protein NLX83_13170 [Allokutzneria sp. A3M-2-11 16]|uniref:hypothetical protein n=1 Tax=Allokutzneria sp. A3M-2-11 16 TaxID=2962043 RepID=UPI0020B84425|nr:hypothetical protein [Allokutzneria sp. A3M-2-11 16]MCP3800210.1 hypothetical protein [Allokutzneria sp. A3M-2-11 16]
MSTIKRSGSRFYVHPETREKVPGVTSVIDMLPKPFLTFWASKVTAETAADNIGAVVQLLVNGDRGGAIDYLKRAPQRFTSDAADIGTEFHNLFEKRARGDRIGRQHPDMEPYLRCIDEFLDRFQPRFLHIEDTVWSDTHHYAGSFDAIAEIEGETVMLDAKSTRSGVHDSVALQLAAYGRADHIVTQTGDTVPIPDITANAVFHVRPEGWKLVPVRADDDVFARFLDLRRIFEWVHTESKSVVGTPLFDSQSTTGSQRRASH